MTNINIHINTIKEFFEIEDVFETLDSVKTFLNKQKIEKLKQFAKSVSIKGYTKMKKPDLIGLLLDNTKIELSNSVVTDSDDEEASYAPSQYLEDANSNPADIFEQDTHNATNSTQLYEAINELDDRSRDILQDRWLADEKLTLHELAEKYNISAERVRQIEKNAMKKVKQSFSSGE